MSHQIMGGGGIDVDMVTGRPQPKTPETRAAAAKNYYRETVQETLALSAELRGSPVLKVLLDQYQARLVFLASQDPECRALEGIVRTIRHRLEVAPLEAEKLVRRVMGPQLAQFIEETEEEAVEAAPEGIPAE
ncbi:MAG: hypothetical protein QME78_00030 [Thermodesulfobacteriota bacterium]|nr:hypothetical protein [Thermodesulfobacteriota bacterium]